MLTQEALAEQANVSVRTIRNIEGGQVVPQVASLRRLARALGLTAEEEASLAVNRFPDPDVPSLDGRNYAAGRHGIETGRHSVNARGPVSVDGLIGVDEHFFDDDEDDLEGHDPFPAREVPWEGPHQRLRPLVGRDQDLSVLLDELTRRRLITLTGSPGVGKTALAIHLAERSTWADGVAVSVLSSDRTGDDVLGSLATTFGLHGHPASETLRLIGERIASRRLLLVLDGCEQVVPACASLLIRLLAFCPGLTVLTTSRRALGLNGELSWQVRRLPGRMSDEMSPAVTLFLRLAAEAAPKRDISTDAHADVARICRRLGGLPLALELVAARLRTLSVAELAERLERDLPRVSSGVSMNGWPAEIDPRRRMLESAVDWSYHLLDPLAQRLLARLTVFPDRFTLRSAELTLEPDEFGPGQILPALFTLVDHALVQALDDECDAPPDGATHYRLLDIVRDYAHKRLPDFTRSPNFP